MRRALEYAGGARASPWPSTARTSGWPAAAHMHEGEWSSRLGLPGIPAAAEEVMVARDLALVPPDRRARALPAPVDGRVGRPGPAGQGRGAAGDRRGDAAPLHPHRRRGRRLRPGLQGEPAAADRRRRRRGARPALADGTIDAIATDHAPHAPEAKEVPFDQAPPGMLGLETALGRRPDRAARCRPSAVLALLTWQPAAIAGLAAGPAAGRPPPRRAGRRRAAAANLCVIDPAAQLGGRRRPAGQPQPQHALRRAGAAAAGSATPSCGASRSSSTARRSDEPGRADGLDATAGAARAGRRRGLRGRGGRGRAARRRSRPASSSSTPRCRGYQEVITDPSYAGQVIAFTYPHIGNYGVNAGDDEAARPFCRGVVVRDLADRAEQLAVAPRDLEDFLVRHGVPAITGVDTRRLTRHLRDAGAMPCAFGTAPEAELRAAAAAAEPGTDGRDLVAGVTTAAPYVRGDGPCRGRRLRLRGQGDHAPPAGRAGHGRRGPGRRRRPPTCWPAEPDGVFLSNGPGDPAALPGPAATVAELARAGADLRHLPRPPAPGRGARRDDLQAALRPPRRQPPGPAPVDRAGRDHQPEPQLRGRPTARSGRRRHPRQPERRGGRGDPLPGGRRLLRAVPPRGRARAARRPLPVRRVPRR